MGKIFISYRRKDTIDIAGRIADWLRNRFGVASVFMDVLSIPAGVPFREYIKDSLIQCRVMVIIIGDDWLTMTGTSGKRRLDDPNDVLRLEIEEALSRGIHLLPVLVQGATMPSAADLPPSIRVLAGINALEVASTRDFQRHMDTLIETIDDLLKRSTGTFPVVKPPDSNTPPRKTAMLVSGASNAPARRPTKKLPTTGLHDGDTVSARAASKKSTALGVESVMIDRGRGSSPSPIDARTLFNALEWCKVPAGSVVLQAITPQHKWEDVLVKVDAFAISRTVITNAQYAAFAMSPTGYHDLRWWQFSSFALEWRRKHPTVMPTTFNGDNHPRVLISWYEAMAFCLWFSAQLGVIVSLPTEAQWQRAAQGNDQREFPWGNGFDASRTQTAESGALGPSSVTAHPNGCSPFGLHDMAGNVQQWCLTDYVSGSASAIDTATARVVRGGSWRTRATRVTQRNKLAPETRIDTLGFRVVLGGKR
jgi:formylglycine-generating enzyme required for sulfatase activity